MNVLEKVKILERYVAVDANAVDPVLEMTIEKLLKRETSRMTDLKERLMRQKQAFEEKYGLGSDEFCRRYDGGTLGDAMDYMEWAATVDMLAGIENRLMLLKKGGAAI